MDHPGFIGHARRYAGHDGLFMDEALVTIRGPGQGVSLHSGAHKRRVRTQYRVGFGQVTTIGNGNHLPIKNCRPSHWPSRSPHYTESTLLLRTSIPSPPCHLYGIF